MRLLQLLKHTKSNKKTKKKKNDYELTLFALWSTIFMKVIGL